MKLALLTLDAPLMSFGAPIIDNLGVVQAWPAASMLVGLLANALGYDRRDWAAHRRLQTRLRYAARRDVAGRPVQDYQTVDLGQPHMKAADVGWTTWGRIEKRGGAAANAVGTHIRKRDHHAGAVYTVALALDPADESPTLAEVAAALRRPARPLFLGRKPCLPAGPVLRRRAGPTSSRPTAPWTPCAVCPWRSALACRPRTPGRSRRGGRPRRRSRCPPCIAGT
ncbi:MAG: type I-E CRISPR-associated protein Cas5/CasD [bacterium]